MAGKTVEMTQDQPRRRRITAVLRHLRPTDAVSNSNSSSSSSSSSSSISADGTSAARAAVAAGPASTAEHLARLERDGVTIVEDVYSQAELAEIRNALSLACGEIVEALPSVTWTEMHYQKMLVEADAFCTGRALYEGKVSAGYKGTEIIDLTKGRFDFYGGVLKDHPPLATAWEAPALVRFCI